MEDSLPRMSAPSLEKLSVLMPVYNEIRTLRTIVRRVLDAPINLSIELIIVDDGSTDGSREVITELADDDYRIRPFFHEKNQGKAGAIRTAIDKMTGDLALIQDADLEYNPADYPILLEPMLEGVADAVFGSRFLAGRCRRILYFWHTVANRILTLVCNVLNDINLTDMETGYKLIRSDILKMIPLTGGGFALEPEITTKLSQWGLRMYEVPISYHGRTYAEGKKIGLKDAFEALWAMVKYRFFAKRFTTHDGFYLLQSVRKSRGFNKWLLNHIQSYVGSRVLEAGCGIGNLSEFFLDRQKLVCVDNDKFYVNRIRDRFGHLENIETRHLDLTNPEECESLEDQDLDTVVCMNVLEHVEDDQQVLENLHDMIQPGGRAILIVPAHPKLYTGVDQSLGHVRRYKREELEEKVAAAGFHVIESQGFNRLGSLGWFLAGKVFGRKRLLPGHMKWFERILPVAKLVEKLPILPYLSRIVVAEKPLGAPVRTRVRNTKELQRDQEEVIAMS
ncbi:MAG: glycosyltransferase [Gemmataceae bacterium]